MSARAVTVFAITNIAIGTITACVGQCFAAPVESSVRAKAAGVPRVLTPLEGKVRPGNAVHEIGSLSLLASGPLTHTFVLRDDTQLPITLDHLQSSCPCTTAIALAEAGGASPMTIRPGQTFSVQVSVDSQQLSPGLLHKSVWVFVQGQDAPAATLEMTGAPLPVASFSPPSLAFGQIEKGTELTMLLKATPHPARLEQGTELRLISPDPDVQVTAVEADSSVGGAMPEEAAQATRAFRIRLAPHAHIGRLQGKLSLVLARIPPRSVLSSIPPRSCPARSAGKASVQGREASAGTGSGREAGRRRPWSAW